VVGKVAGGACGECEQIDTEGRVVAKPRISQPRVKARLAGGGM